MMVAVMRLFCAQFHLSLSSIDADVDCIIHGAFVSLIHFNVGALKL